MTNVVRKNISMNNNDFELINKYAKKEGVSFSEFLCKSAIDKINNDEEKDLLYYLAKNCDYVSEEEQKEIDDMNIDYNNIDGRELTVNDLL